MMIIVTALMVVTSHIHRLVHTCLVHTCWLDNVNLHAITTIITTMGGVLMVVTMMVV